MIRTFLYLTGCSMRNRAARRLRRLREPRYLAGFAVGLAYLYFGVLRHQLRPGRRGDDLFADPDVVAVLPFVLAFGALMMWLFTLAAWFWPSREPPLKFTGPEVQFFYTAPVTRRQILNYKLLRSQVGVVFGVLIAALFSGAATAAAAGRWTYLAGGLVLFSTLRLHLLGIGLTRAGFSTGGAGVPLRGWVPGTIVAALSALIVAPVLVHATELYGLGFSPAVGRVVELTRTLPAAIGLWPFAALLAPILSPAGDAFFRALLPALGLLAINYWWVLQSDVVLAEAAVTTEKQQAKGAGRLPAPVARKAPFRLAPTGRPELAVFWKNLILQGRYASPRMLLRTLLPLLLVAVAFRKSRAGDLLSPLPLMFAAFFTLLGPFMVRNDLRHDLPRLPVLKTWPVRGWSLLLGELLAPAVVLTVLAWTFLGAWVALSGAREFEWASPAEHAALAAIAALLAPAIIAAQLLIQNAAVILFPGWIQTGGSRPRGIEAMGQQMLMLAGTLTALLVGVLPAAAVAGAVGFVLYQLAGLAGLIPAALLFVLVLFLEGALAVVLLGRVLERTEPSQVEGDAS